jgi:5'-3' exonuclease
MSQQIERLPKGKAVCLIDADSLLYFEMGKDTLEEAITGLDQRIHDILHQCNTTKYAGFLTQGKCFRYEVDCEYKGKRKKSNRSILFPSLKEYSMQRWGFKYVTELEADDLVSYYSYNHDENTIICSPDKDVLKQCVGMHYNYGKAEFLHTSPDEALKFLWIQVLMGDSTDNIVGIPGVGIKTAENWLKDRTKDFESFAVRKYVEKFGMVEGIREFYKNFNLVYLLKTDEDLARLELALPPLECIDISQNELDIWGDDE